MAMEARSPLNSSTCSLCGMSSVPVDDACDRRGQHPGLVRQQLRRGVGEAGPRRGCRAARTSTAAGGSVRPSATPQPATSTPRPRARRERQEPVKRRVMPAAGRGDGGEDERGEYDARTGRR